ncbi:hypothetical protein CANTEDRAFT_113213 [Yamadazyma tenuis ATCC 10573]|uniref:Uncharacterized protein n=1 Tax=Candida tenuis (strain ATCC 10573 / BCRC 21748 / CBS 615 / JCM 9827 / NBRC 10315 / NRRL Y-1498 / VKM Y-70) TaxID=590646 RepID=G3B1J3_CANTC|nr:uncharacterized protein CANTEDRAFT_113213 [Yamadazyma tenuis ATCC 10573]EGV64458.1 hypothetical protein CANTEDRAFT_113213 [Yamadazyma tenuis ATCC 10573]
MAVPESSVAGSVGITTPETSEASSTGETFPESVTTYEAMGSKASFTFMVGISAILWILL